MQTRSTASSKSSTMQFIGRRTGKVISIKSYDELFSDSEADATLDITRTPSTREVAGNSSIAAKPNNKKVVPEGSKDGSFFRPLSAKQNVKKVQHSRIGRRTGKDLFAGNKKLQETGKIENYNDLFSDTDESMSLHPTPEKTISSASLASCEESDASVRQSPRRKKNLSRSIHSVSVRSLVEMCTDDSVKVDGDLNNMKTADRSVNDENSGRNTSSPTRGSNRNHSVLNSTSTNKGLDSSSLLVRAGAMDRPGKSPNKSRLAVQTLSTSNSSSPLISSTRIEARSDSSVIIANESEIREDKNNTTIVVEDESSRTSTPPARSGARKKSRQDSMINGESSLLANSSRIDVVDKPNNRTLGESSRASPSHARSGARKKSRQDSMINGESSLPANSSRIDVVDKPNNRTLGESSRASPSHARSGARKKSRQDSMINGESSLPANSSRIDVVDKPNNRTLGESSRASPSHARSGARKKSRQDSMNNGESSLPANSSRIDVVDKPNNRTLGEGSRASPSFARSGARNKSKQDSMIKGESSLPANSSKIDIVDIPNNRTVGDKSLQYPVLEQEENDTLMLKEASPVHPANKSRSVSVRRSSSRNLPTQKELENSLRTSAVNEDDRDGGDDSDKHSSLGRNDSKVELSHPANKSRSVSVRRSSSRNLPTQKELENSLRTSAVNEDDRDGGDDSDKHSSLGRNDSKVELSHPANKSRSVSLRRSSSRNLPTQKELENSFRTSAANEDDRDGGDDSDKHPSLGRKDSKVELSQSKTRIETPSVAEKENFEPAPGEDNGPVTTEIEVQKTALETSVIEIGDSSDGVQMTTLQSSVIEIGDSSDGQKELGGSNTDKATMDESGRRGDPPKNRSSSSVRLESEVDGNQGESQSSVPTKQTPTDPGSGPSTSQGQCLDFGGTAAGSVSNADKVLPSQFFGIKKRLTFCKGLGDSRNSLEAAFKEMESAGVRKSYPGSFLVHHSKGKSETSFAQAPLEPYHGLAGLDMSTDSSDGFRILDREVDPLASKKQNSFVTITGRRRSSSGDGAKKRRTSGEEKKIEDSGVERQNKSVDGKNSKEEKEKRGRVNSSAVNSFSVVDTNDVDIATGSSSGSDGRSDSDGGGRNVRSKIPVRRRKSTASPKTVDKSVAEHTLNVTLSANDDIVVEGSKDGPLSGLESKQAKTPTCVKKEKGIAKKNSAARKRGRRKADESNTNDVDDDDIVTGNFNVGSPEQQLNDNGDQHTSLSHTFVGSINENLEKTGKESPVKETSNIDDGVISEARPSSAVGKKGTRLRLRNENIVDDDQVEEQGNDGEKTINGTFTVEENGDAVDPVLPQESAVAVSSSEKKSKTKNDKGGEKKSKLNPVLPQESAVAVSSSQKKSKTKNDKDGEKKSKLKRGKRKGKDDNVVQGGNDEDESQIHENREVVEIQGDDEASSPVSTSQDGVKDKEDDAWSPVKKARKSRNEKKKKKNAKNESSHDVESASSSSSLSKSPLLSGGGVRKGKMYKKGAGANKRVSTPVRLHPMSMLPRVTPTSGISFRRKSSFIASLHASVDDLDSPQGQDEIVFGGAGDDAPITPFSGMVPVKGLKRVLLDSLVEDVSVHDSEPVTHDEIAGDDAPTTPYSGFVPVKVSKRVLLNSLIGDVVPVHDSEPVTHDDQPQTPPKVSRSRRSGGVSLLKRAILESARSKGLRVIAGDTIPSPALGVIPIPVNQSPEPVAGPSNDSTFLPSPSSSPVHYAETTMSDKRRSNTGVVVLPDLSYKIIRPDTCKSGLRRSKRTRVQRLHDYKGEGIVYKRDSAGFRVVHSIMPSVAEAKLLALERIKTKKRKQRKLQANAVPAKNRRMSTHIPLESDDVTENSEISVINPDTEERVVVELLSHSHDAKWVGPELSTLTSRDSFGMSVLLNQPSFCSGELHIRPLCEKPRQATIETVVYFLIRGKVCVSVNNSSFIVENRDDFFIPRGSVYKIKNMRRDIAQLKFLNLHDSTSGNTTISPANR